MGLFDKAKDLVSEHSDKVAHGIDKAGRLVEEKTGGRYSDLVGRGQDLARDRLADLGRDEPAEPTAEPQAGPAAQPASSPGAEPSVPDHPPAC